MEKTVCGAKTRKGTPCQKNPLSNGRCRLHGGKSTGPKDREKKSEQMKGNKNALTTGEYESISYDTLLDDEKELIGQIPEDPYKNAEGRYKLLEIRTRRLMKRYTDEMLKEKPDFSKVESLDEALTRHDSRAVDLIRLKKELLEGHGDKDNGSIDVLTGILANMRDMRKIPK